MEQRLIVGLGNPGKSYEMTRHNLGFLVVCEFAKRHGFTFKLSKRLDGMLAKGIVYGSSVYLLLPMAFMNRSGSSVRKTVDYYKFMREELILVTDDTALDYGRMRLRAQGSCGGHNGLRDVELHLGTSQYLRLRIGIGNRAFGSLEQYVLSKFSREEEKLLPEILKKAVDALDCWLQYGDEKAIEFSNSQRLR